MGDPAADLALTLYDYAERPPGYDSVSRDSLPSSSSSSPFPLSSLVVLALRRSRTRRSRFVSFRFVSAR